MIDNAYEIAEAGQRETEAYEEAYAYEIAEAEQREAEAYEEASAYEIAEVEQPACPSES